MHFSDASDITIVITSCGRFDLLKQTLNSLDALNTTPIHSVIIAEDSSDEHVRGVIPTHWQSKTQVLVNNPKLGQLASIDLAYSRVTTPYIFHCEDDWEFYRPGFIEASRCILEEMPNVLQVWLRSYTHDVRVSYPFHSLGERFIIQGHACSRLLSSNGAWQGFSFNPGLRRKRDYLLFAPFARFATSAEGESELSKGYAQEGFFAVVLESDAVRHIGGDAHVWGPADAKRRRQKQARKRRRIMAALGLLGLGMLLGLLCARFL